VTPSVALLQDLLALKGRLPPARLDRLWRLVDWVVRELLRELTSCLQFKEVVRQSVVGVFRARRTVIYANLHRGPGDRFLGVEGPEAILQSHLDLGAVEKT
jgi:hypothetical protein